MNSVAESFIKELQKEIDNGSDDGEFADFCEEKLEQIQGRDDKFEFIEPILKLFEQNPDFDFGSPGDLTRFIESFYKKGYEAKLVESIRRKPTEHTLWLLNRVINGVPDEEKAKFISVLEGLLKIQILEVK